MIEILPIREEHIAGFHTALGVVARERRYLAWTEAPPIESTRAFVKDNIQRCVPQFVALDEARVVGWCDVSLSSRPVFAHCGQLGMGVLPEYRGQGIGTRLLNEALKRAKELGLERVELEVYESNVVAARLYEKFGFRREGLKIKATKLDGRYENNLIMALFLEDYDPPG